MDLVQIRYLQDKIDKLPKGNITYKTINGKKYPYHQWRENGKQKSCIVKESELAQLIKDIATRKKIENQLKKLAVSQQTTIEEEYFSLIKCDDELLAFVNPTRLLKKRHCFSELRDYVYGDSIDKVFVLYGLRRTGKTTLIRQIICDMPKEMQSKTAYLQITSSIDLEKINLDLRKLSRQGYKYIFIDEVTLMEDFIEHAALFSDVFASTGMKIVLSGTDSLGFRLTESNELYDRCFMLHTTFIPYREFEKVLGVKGIDNYIQYGGTMSTSGKNYNQDNNIFSTVEKTNEYIGTAIAKNIQHSLKNYEGGEHFLGLAELYEENELTNAINRVVEDINHRFTIEVLTKEFKSGDLSISSKNMLKDRENPSDILLQINKDDITEKLRKTLEIKNQDEQKIKLQDHHIRQIKEYLNMLDLIIDIDVVDINDFNKKTTNIVFSQPGLRYAQAKALVEHIMADEIFRNFSLKERNLATRRILSEVQGRMMEEIVLLETKKALPQCKVFKLKFTIGEFDMVVFNPETASCKIYEIKHSTERVPQQLVHLKDKTKCEQTEFRYGDIEGKYLIYRGESCFENGIHYVNVEEYLNSMPDSLNQS
ncbi:MAG: AAA family ATPase [Phascolarctobacterium sp.]|nr:AAA family ATPase [Phascolarctobacterium sp.]